MTEGWNRRAVLAGAAALATGGAGSSPGRAWGEDAEVLRAAYTAMHPGLYRYASPEVVSARFDRLGRALAQAPDQQAAFLALSRFTAGVRCGHTYPNPYNQSKAAVATLFSGRVAPPFLFRWLDGRMIVTDDLSGGRFARGDEVTAYAGLSPREMLRTLTTVSRADGAADAKRVANMENRGDDRFEAFDVHAPLLWPRLRDGGATLSVRAADGRERSVDAPFLTREEKLARRPVPSEAAVPWTLSRRPDGVAVLTMPGWALYNSKWDWKAWLDAAMDDLAETRAPGLVVDLRGNEGGLDCGNVLIERIAAVDVRGNAWRRRVRYRKAPVALEPYLDTWDKSFLDWGDKAVGPESDGFYRLTRWDDDAEGDLFRPRGKRYAGPVVVLTDASNSSATFGFACVVQRAGLATLVGGTTGGNRRGINGGAFFFLRLPNTGLEVDLPLVGTFSVAPQPDAPVEPDVPVYAAAQDVAAGRDPVLERALQVIGRL